MEQFYGFIEKGQDSRDKPNLIKKDGILKQIRNYKPIHLQETWLHFNEVS